MAPMSRPNSPPPPMITERWRRSARAAPPIPTASTPCRRRVPSGSRLTTVTRCPTEPRQQPGQDRLVADVAVAVGPDDEDRLGSRSTAMLMGRALAADEDPVRTERAGHLEAERLEARLPRPIRRVGGEEQRGTDVIVLDQFRRIEEAEADRRSRRRSGP